MAGTAHFNRKHRLLIVAAACVLLAASFLTWHLASAAASQPPSLRFIGFSNLADAQEPTDAGLRKFFGTALETWEASGTNVALFAFTNSEDHSIVVNPAIGRLVDREGNPALNTFFLPCTNFGAIFLAPGQGVIIRAAFPQRLGPWKMRLLYQRDSTEHTFSDVVRGIAMALGSRTPTRKSSVETEWIENLPSRQPRRADERGSPNHLLSPERF